MSKLTRLKKVNRQKANQYRNSMNQVGLEKITPVLTYLHHEIPPPYHQHK